MHPYVPRRMVILSACSDFPCRAIRIQFRCVFRGPSMLSKTNTWTIARALALGVFLTLIPGIRTACAQEYDPTPDEPKSYKAPEPSNQTPHSNPENIQISPSLTISLPLEIEGSSLGSPRDREFVRDGYIREFESLADLPVSPKKQMRIISLVNDTDTDRALDAVKSLVLAPQSKTLDAVERLLVDNRDRMIVIIGHIDARNRTFGHLSMADLAHRAQLSGARVLFLGCNSANFTGSGATQTINSIEVVEKLSQATGATTFGEFLNRLSGPELQLQLQWSMLKEMANRLHLIAMDKNGEKQLDILIVGFNEVLCERPTPTQTLSRLSVRWMIPYILVVSTSLLAFFSCLFLLGCAAYSPLWRRGARALAQFSQLFIKLVLVGSPLAIGRATVLLLGAVGADLKFWMPAVMLAVVLLMGKLWDVAASVNFPVNLPVWVQISTGLIVVWSLASMASYLVFG
jgi:hypothetical protein